MKLISQSLKKKIIESLEEGLFYRKISSKYYFFIDLVSKIQQSYNNHIGKNKSGQKEKFLVTAKRSILRAI